MSAATDFFARTGQPSPEDHVSAGSLVPGDFFWARSRWREVRKIAGATGGRMHLMCVDGSSWLADPRAHRRIVRRPSSSEVVAP